MERSLLATLEQARTRFVRLLWCDNGGLIRGKAIHYGRLNAYAQTGVGIAAAQQAVPVHLDAPAPGSDLGPVGEVRLVPDWSTLALLPYAPGHARVLGDLVRDGLPWACCPRAALRLAIARAADQQLSIKAAFENEFFLLQPGEALVPADRQPFAAAAAMDLHQPVIDAIAEALLAQGIQVEHYYPESGWGQQEISILYTEALDAANQQIVFRETVKAIARQHGQIASFLPKIFPDQAGSGCHLHLSLWRGGQNLLASETGELAPLGRQFLAGLLAHLPGLMALTVPSVNSYRRLQPHCWSGAFRCWGYDNREAALRVPTNASAPSPTHLEVKTVDATSNPYLALAGIIAAGLDGIERQLPLPEPVTVDPGTLPEAERLPVNLGEAIAALDADPLLCNALGPELARTYLAVRRAEWTALGAWELAQEVELLRERY